MGVDDILKSMREIEFKLENLNLSFNEDSGKFIEHERAMNKLVVEYEALNCEYSLLFPFENIEYNESNLDSGTRHRKAEFKALCGEGVYNDDNGYGFYIHNDTISQETSNIEIKPSWALSNKMRRDFDEIIWYAADDIEVDNQVTNAVSFEDLEEEF